MSLPPEHVLADLVLEALVEGPRTGFEIATTLETEFGASLKGREGALYAELIRLERDGFVDGAWEESPPDRRRRTYRLPVLVDLNALTAPAAPQPAPTEPDEPEIPA
jgi:DNA-binding PadR family transcriptional regulator